MFPFCEKSIPHQWECFRNQNYFALSAAAAAGLLLRVCSAGFASASFASAGRASAGCASAGCVPQGVFRRVCSAGVASRALLLRALLLRALLLRVCSAVFPLRRGKCRMQQAVRQAAERGWRRSDGVQEAFGWRSGASVCRRIRSGAASVFEQPDCRSTFERFLAIHSLRPLCFVIDPDIQKKEPPKRLLKCG